MNETLFTLIAGSAARPGTPTALWLGSTGPEPAAPRKRRRLALRLRPDATIRFDPRRLLRLRAGEPSPGAAVSAPTGGGPR